jgi:hypothetical protein
MRNLILADFGQVCHVLVLAQALPELFILTLNLLQRFPENFEKIESCHKYQRVG